MAGNQLETGQDLQNTKFRPAVRYFDYSDLRVKHWRYRLGLSTKTTNQGISTSYTY